MTYLIIALEDAAQSSFPNPTAYTSLTHRLAQLTARNQFSKSREPPTYLYRPKAENKDKGTYQG